MPGLELLGHIQPPKAGPAGRVELIIDVNEKGEFTHYSGRNFTAGQVYGYTIRTYPDNEYLLASFGYTLENNTFDYLQLGLKNALPVFGPTIREVAKYVKCFEGEATMEQAEKGEHLFYDIGRSTHPNSRLLNYARFESCDKSSSG